MHTRKFGNSLFYARSKQKRVHNEIQDEKRMDGELNNPEEEQLTKKKQFATDSYCLHDRRCNEPIRRESC